MAAQSNPGVEYLPVNVYFPHDGTAEKEGMLHVKVGDSWAQRRCAVRGNFLFIFGETDGKETLDEQDVESVSLQETTTGKKKSSKKEQKPATYALVAHVCVCVCLHD